MAAASETEPEESANDSPAGFDAPSSLILGPIENTALRDQPTVAGLPPGSPGLAGLPQELNDHHRTACGSANRFTWPFAKRPRRSIKR
jgi:hypothetical protein